MMAIQEYIKQAQVSEQNRKLFVAQFIDDFIKANSVQCLETEIKDADITSKLFEATAHQLCIILNLKIPNWLLRPNKLKDPFFVSNLEHSKFLALRDSPYGFRIRNIFVPYNNLSRF